MQYENRDTNKEKKKISRKTMEGDNIRKIRWEKLEEGKKTTEDNKTKTDEDNTKKMR